MASERNEEKKQEVDEIEDEKKKKQAPWWQSIPPMVLIGGGVLLFFALKSIMSNPETKNQNILLIVIIVVILYLLSKQQKDLGIVTPEEAELLAEQGMRRKIKWEQWPLMTKVRIGPVIELVHRDARGMYYAIAGEAINPYEGISKYYVITVMARGIERGFTVVKEHIGPFTGRDDEWRQQHEVMPDFIKYTRRDPLLEKLFRPGGGFR